MFRPAPAPQPRPAPHHRHVDGQGPQHLDAVGRKIHLGVGIGALDYLHRLGAGRRVGGKGEARWPRPEQVLLDLDQRFDHRQRHARLPDKGAQRRNADIQGRHRDLAARLAVGVGHGRELHHGQVTRLQGQRHVAELDLRAGWHGADDELLHRLAQEGERQRGDQQHEVENRERQERCGRDDQHEPAGPRPAAHGAVGGR